MAETSRTVMGVLGGTSTSSGHKRRMTSHTDVLAQIEDEGWKLEHVGYVFEPTGTVSRDKAFSSGRRRHVGQDRRCLPVPREPGLDTAGGRRGPSRLND